MIDKVPTYVRNSQGQLVINPRKVDMASFYLTPDAPNNPVVLGAGATSGPLSFTVSQDGPAEFFYLLHEKTNATLVTVDLFDESSRLRLNNRAIHIDTMFGQRTPAIAGVEMGVLPHLLAETLWVQPSRSVLMTFNDGAAGNTIYPIMCGRRFYNYANPSQQMAESVEKRNARSRLSSPFWLTTDNNDIAVLGGAAGLGFLRTPASGYFECWKICTFSTGAFSWRITEPNGRTNSNDWIHNRAGTGTGPLPLVLPEPTVYAPNTNLRLDVVDLSAAPNTIYFTMVGRIINVA